MSQTFSKYFIVMQVDGAGWRHSDELVVPSNIRLIAQPPYTPKSTRWNTSGTNYAKNTLGTGPSPRLTP